MASSTTSVPSTQHHANVVPSEVGWQFVPQYYTYMNKQPNRLHCFYTKNSTFIHGTEGEDVKPCYGQHEIHNKILSIGFNDCKVFINSVDAQSSANGGIIIQVIGEMSNNAEPWRKFAQTFFLAEQPNGYFVLNDIFRYLKEEAVDTEEIDGAEVVAPAEPEAAAFAASVPPDEAVVEQAIEEPVTTQPTTIEEENVEPKVNGISHAEPVVSEPELQPAMPAMPATPEPVREPTPAPEEPTPAEEPTEPEESAQPTPSPPVVPPSVLIPPQSSLPAPAQSQAPPAHKTWANLAAKDSNKWGNAVAQEAKGVSASAVPSVSPLPSGATTPSKDGRTTPARTAKGDRDTRSPAYAAAMAVTTPQCFVKGVVEVVSHQNLTSTLTSRFGPIKDVEIVRSKACAFIEFGSLDSAKRAIAASLPQNQGGEGGIRLDVGSEEQVRVIVETRKERAERPNPRQRTAPTGSSGEQRGGFRNRGAAGGGRGRGAAAASSGTPK